MIIANVEFELPKGPVGVLCSGGADSSLVLYLLMKYSTEPIHVFTLSNAKKHYTNSVIINYIIKWCLENTNNHNITLHTWFAAEQTNRELGKLPAEFLSNKKIYKLYIGDTCYPPDDINLQFASNGYDVFQNMKDRDPNITRSTGIGPFYYPFTNYNKKKIAEIYRHENIMELFTLTRSCESGDNIGSQHCQKCWWCQERAWAFDLTNM